jgi:hypothetical protein
MAGDVPPTLEDIKIMAMSSLKTVLTLVAGLSLATGVSNAKSGSAPAAEPAASRYDEYLARYTRMLEKIVAELANALPIADKRLVATLDQAQEAVTKAEAAAEAAQKNFGGIGGAQALVAHAKDKWIADAEKGIAQSQAALKNAGTDAEREAAKADLAKWEANKQEGLQALKEREEAYNSAKRNEAQYRREHESAQAALAKAREAEMDAAKQLLASMHMVFETAKPDATLCIGAILASATPRGLANFAEDKPDNAALVDQLLADTGLMMEMHTAGGAAYGEWANAMSIFTAIQKASTLAADGHFRRLAIATSLEHAQATGNDPVKRYLHYEKAFLDGELDPAFKHFTTWEYRHVVNCDAPDEILQWGRTMLRNYRPDHIYNPDYGWRYVSSVRTEVPYGSQNVQYDDPERHQYQNIIRNGGVCGRRAFYGRFILRAFGIPTWGVTQRAHAALSHWTPNGWVVNLGAGYGSSWWDKDEVSLSGNHFLLETQARAHTDEYARVIRAQLISRILGEPAYNERRKVAGGFWSRIALYQQRVLAATSVSLGALGEELAEANESEQKINSAEVTPADRKTKIEDGVVIVPAVANDEASGKSAAMRSFGGGMQLHCLGGFRTAYKVTVPRGGRYHLTVRVATVQTGQQFIISAHRKGESHEIDVPYTLGMWEHTEPLELDLKQGKTTILLELKEGSRGVTIKELQLKPVW